MKSGLRQTGCANVCEWDRNRPGQGPRWDSVNIMLNICPVSREYPQLLNYNQLSRNSLSWTLYSVCSSNLLTGFTLNNNNNNNNNNNKYKTYFTFKIALHVAQL